MNGYFYKLFGGTLLMLICAVGAAEPNPSVSFSDFAAGVRLENTTEYAAKVFWQQWRGRQVTWTGVVSEVRVGSRCELYLAAPLEPTYRGYNFVAVSRDTVTCRTLQKGAQIQVIGLLHRYRARLGQPVIGTLKEAQIGLFREPEVEDVPKAAPPPAAPPPGSVTVVPTQTDCRTFIEALSSANVTELAARTNWSALQPYNVAWTATVVDVKGGHGEADVYLACDKLPLVRGYNIILSTRDKSGAAALVKGQPISFSGIPHRYTYRPGTPTVVTIREGLRPRLEYLLIDEGDLFGYGARYP